MAHVEVVEDVTHLGTVKRDVWVADDQWESEHWGLLMADHGPRVFPPVRCSECENAIHDLIVACGARSRKKQS